MYCEYCKKKIGSAYRWCTWRCMELSFQQKQKEMKKMKDEILDLKCPNCNYKPREYVKAHLIEYQESITFWCPNIDCYVSRIIITTWDTGKLVDRIKELKR